VKNYSHVICIGDSFTNEREHYNDVGLIDVFKKINYEYKSYPEIISEHYSAECITIGKPGRTMTYTIQDLIKNINYILTLDNPLVIYQFGYFMNAQIKLSEDFDIMWKDVANMKSLNHAETIINKKTEFIDNISEIDKLSIINWFEKFEEFRNYYFIEYFLSLIKHIKGIKNIDIFGFFLTPTMFPIPKKENLLWLFDKGYGYDGLRDYEDGIDLYIKELGLSDGHKSTNGNIKLANEIIKQINNQLINL